MSDSSSKNVARAIRLFFAERFNLNDDKAEEKEIIEDIKANVAFKGTNVWTLIFAIFIASIGLNVNSTAVIIGAMLISPLMGPIMGIGLSIGINDLELLQKSAKNLAITAGISIVTSFLYFLISPLHDASSELLARTNPSIWDVFIAFLGGLAGIVASTRKKKSNVIPGVAIATALMPPLCTVGFGLATGQWVFALGALYLFFINSLFICLATFLIVKRLRFHRVEFTTPDREKRVSRFFLVMVVLTVAPSIYFGYRIVQKSLFENSANNFVQNEFVFTRTQVVTRNYIFEGNHRAVEVLLVGQPVTDEVIDTLKRKMPQYGLGNAKLIVRQGLEEQQKIDVSEIKASVLEEVYANQKARDLARSKNKMELPMPDVKEEIIALYPGIQSYSLSQTIMYDIDSNRADTVTLFTGQFKKALPTADKNRLQDWLKQRVKADTVVLMLR